MTVNLEGFKNIKCLSCRSNLKFEVKRSFLFGFCTNSGCSKIWMLSKNSKGRVLAFECYEKKFLIEFYVELPFNLGFPTGRYYFNKANELMIRRDMYYFQKDNELENPRTMQPYFAFQVGAFNEFGLFKEEHNDKNYKRKMKSVLFKRYSVSGIIRKDIEIEKFLESNYIKETIFKVQVQFQYDINEFLMYYSLFFPINDLKGLYQHEVRPISIYEFNKCLFNCQAIIDKKPYSIPPIIQDVTNFKGIPDITYSNSNEKIKEFEKLIAHRQNIPILYHQQLFILARSLFRTNKRYMGATIIATAMTAYEALIHNLENSHIHFKKLKNVRKNILKNHPNLTKPGKRAFGFLEFYTEYAKPSIARLINSTHKEAFSNYKEILKHLKNLNISRWIRNNIVHKAEFNTTIIIDYELEKGFTDDYLITYTNKSTRTQHQIDFNNLWNSFLKIYDVLNKILLETISNRINWNIKSIFDKENLAFSTKTGKGIIDTIFNINWREIKSYNFTLKQTAVPPELFLVNIISSDKKEICINISKETKKFERFDDPLIRIQSDLTMRKIKKLIKKKVFFAYLVKDGKSYYYNSCDQCGYILPIHLHHDYNNNICSRCQSEFDLKEKWLLVGTDLYNREKFQDTILCFKKVLEIDPNNNNALNNIAASLVNLEKYEEAIHYLEKINFNDLDDKMKIIGLVHKGITYYELNEISKAIELINKALEINPDNIFTLHTKCVYLIKENKLNQAIIICDKLIELDENYSYTYYFKARIESIRGNYSTAINYLSKAIPLNPKIKKIAIEEPNFENIKHLKEFNDLIS